jgi:hypothetical protein
VRTGLVVHDYLILTLIHQIRNHRFPLRPVYLPTFCASAATLILHIKHQPRDAMYKLESLPNDYCDESEADMTEQVESSEEDDHSMLGEAEEEYMSEGDEFISPQMRDFVVPSAIDES